MLVMLDKAAEGKASDSRTDKPIFPSWSHVC